MTMLKATLLLLAGVLLGNADRLLNTVVSRVLYPNQVVFLRQDLPISSTFFPNSSGSSTIIGTVHKDSQVTVTMLKGPAAYIRLDTIVERSALDNAMAPSP